MTAVLRLLRLVRRGLTTALPVVLLAACAAPKYTIDDGRPVNETLLSNIRLLGEGERKLRPAIVRSAALNDPDCSTQWELPFSVASSYEWDEDDRVAWVRALQVDERLTVISTASGSPLDIGDKLVEIDGYNRQNSAKMLAELASRRDSGTPFPVTTADGRTLTITPLKVCRGYTRLAAPSLPFHQDFHWLMNTHPLGIFNPLVTPDEALWMVLWGQGLSEEGGARMKTFHYGKNFIMTLVDVASTVYGLNAAAQSAQLAAKQLMTTAGSAITKSVSDAAARQMLEQASKEIAQMGAKEYGRKMLLEAGKSAGLRAGKEIAVAASESYAARVGLSVSALSLVASTSFDKADTWAFERMGKLGADPLAGASLHRKLLDMGLSINAFTFDEERLGNLAQTAQRHRLEAPFLSTVRGVGPDGVVVGELQSASATDTDPPSTVEPMAMPSSAD